MAPRDLDLEVTHRGRHADEFSARCDPSDTASLSRMLRDWLAANGWAGARWGEFELLVRFAGEYRVRGKVRA